MTNAPKLIFCFPYHGVGGVSLLFMRVAEELVKVYDVNASLVDYADGFMGINRQEGLTHFIEYRDDESVAIPEDAILIFQSMTPWSIFPFLQIPPSVRILYWNCHPFNLVPTLPGFRKQMQSSYSCGRFVLNTVLNGYRLKMVKLFRLLEDKHSIVFMDKGNVTTTERYLGISIQNPVYLPIPVDKPLRRKTIVNKDHLTGGLNIAWLGRIADFKYFILKYALKKLDGVQPELDLPIKFIVIGSGDFDAQLREEVSKLANLTVQFIDHIPPSDLDNFLCQEVDMVMAMGTSALEGAKLGIPTVLLDVCYNEVSDGYIFQWLHECTGYTLGDVVDGTHFKAGNRSLQQCLQQLLSEYERVSKQSLEHFEMYHSISSVTNQLMQIINRVTCTYADFGRANLIGRGIIYNSFDFLRKKLIKRK